MTPSVCSVRRLGTLLLILSLSRVADAAIEFNRDIRPILSDKCYACHGPDKNARKGKLRLDRHEDAVAARDPHAAVVPGKPDESTLIERINTGDPDDIMPPPETGKPLSKREKELLRDWVAAGAAWQDHWSYLPVKRPLIPGLESAPASQVSGLKASD